MYSTVQYPCSKLHVLKLFTWKNINENTIWSSANNNSELVLIFALSSFNHSFEQLYQWFLFIHKNAKIRGPPIKFDYQSWGKQFPLSKVLVWINTVNLKRHNQSFCFYWATVGINLTQISRENMNVVSSKHRKHSIWHSRQTKKNLHKIHIHKVHLSRNLCAK